MDVNRIIRKGWPVTIELAATLPGPPDVVWELITDWEHLSDWMLEGSDFTLVSEAREGIGVEAEATISIAGITTRDVVRVVAWEPHTRLGMEHLGWVSGRGDMFLTLLDEGRTHLFWREELQPPLGILGGLGLLGFKPLMTRIFQRDLHVLAGLTRVRVGERG